MIEGHELTTAGSNDITLGEVYRRIVSLENRVAESQRASDDRLTQALTDVVRRDIWQVEHQDLEARIANLERTKRDTTNFERALLVGILGSILTSVGVIVANLVH